MKFWDSSAIVPLVVEEASSRAMRDELEDDGDLVVWWATPVECVSALVRSRRTGRISDEAPAIARLDWIARRWREVEPAPEIRDTARRLIRVHEGLRAGDAVQLAAALAVAERRPSSLGFVCLDDRLKSAADREGLRVRP